MTEAFALSMGTQFTGDKCGETDLLYILRPRKIYYAHLNTEN